MPMKIYFLSCVSWTMILQFRLSWLLSFFHLQVVRTISVPSRRIASTGCFLVATDCMHRLTGSSGNIISLSNWLAPGFVVRRRKQHPYCIPSKLQQQHRSPSAKGTIFGSTATTMIRMKTNSKNDVTKNIESFGCSMEDGTSNQYNSELIVHTRSSLHCVTPPLRRSPRFLPKARLDNNTGQSLFVPRRVHGWNNNDSHEKNEIRTAVTPSYFDNDDENKFTNDNIIQSSSSSSSSSLVRNTNNVATSTIRKQQQIRKKRPTSSKIIVPPIVSSSSSDEIITSKKRRKNPQKKSPVTENNAAEVSSIDDENKNSNENNNNNKNSIQSPMTQSFGPATRRRNNSGFDDDYLPSSDTFVSGDEVKPHTLILGTHPSIMSFTKSQYYGHPMNAFWWIVGDCFGFRRDVGCSSSTGLPYQFTKSLRYGIDRVIPYDEQITLLLQHGFLLWDVIQSCTRIGSLDSNIRNEVPNDIYSFCKAHPTIRRIVFTNGSSGGQYFSKYNKEWLQSGELEPHPDHLQSQKVFARYCSISQTKSKSKKRIENSDNNGRNGMANDDDDDNNNIMVEAATNSHDSNSSSLFGSNHSAKKEKIILISAISVSPTAASYTYEQKRDFWEQYVYKPGLLDHEKYSTSSYFSK